MIRTESCEVLFKTMVRLAEVMQLLKGVLQSTFLSVLQENATSSHHCRLSHKTLFEPVNWQLMVTCVPNLIPKPQEAAVSNSATG